MKIEGKIIFEDYSNIYNVAYKLIKYTVQMRVKNIKVKRDISAITTNELMCYSA